MKKILFRIFRYLAQRFEGGQQEAISPQQEIKQEGIPDQSLSLEAEESNLILMPNTPVGKPIKEKENPRRKKPRIGEIIGYDPRDIMEVMEVPFLALSKNRTKPIIYERKDGKVKVKISAHREHYLASIYDWDIILILSNKLQEILNSDSDIPPKTIIIPRSKLLKAIHKHDGKTNRKEIEASLARLKLTGIETTIRNEDYRYRGGFGFLDSWGYTERKDMKEFRITLSDWLYDGICKKGSLLKVSQEYFDITSGLKKFLYRTARKHVGKNEFWEFSIEKLYEKSGSEQEFKKFKYDLKKAILDNDIPEYSLEWRENGDKTLVRFSNKNKYSSEIDSRAIQGQVKAVVSSLKIPLHITK